MSNWENVWKQQFWRNSGHNRWHECCVEDKVYVSGKLREVICCVSSVAMYF